MKNAGKACNNRLYRHIRTFEKIVKNYFVIYDTLLTLLNKYPLKSPAKLQILSRETIARFYTFGLADSVKYAIMHDITYTPEEIAAAYNYLIHNSAFDLVEHPRI